jgi:endonuclease/exonuclease/phosphatase family metal-dependent hydrolase
VLIDLISGGPMRLLEQFARLSVRVALVFGAMLAIAAPVAAQSDIVMGAAPSAIAGKWAVVSDTTAAGGKAVRNADAGGAKVATAAASPANYFEVKFPVNAGTPYRLWVHGKADKDSWANDSVFVQFSGSVTASGAATYRIGTTSSAEVNLEDCSGCGVNGWKWQDNGYGKGSLGPLVYFASTGTQTLRVQTREDGLSIDQIVLSPVDFLAAAPQGLLTVNVPAPTTTTTTTPPPPTTTSTSATLKVLDWNTHHGVGTDGVCNLDRFIPYIVNSGANVVSLNEVEKNVGSYCNVDQPAKYASLLKAATGKTWYYKFAQRDGNTNGQGNLLLTTFAIQDSDEHQLSYSRSVAYIQIIVNGLRVNLFSTHLDADSSSRRTTQMGQLKSWAGSFAEQRILAGDYNAWPGAGEIANMTGAYVDTWAQAVKDNTDLSYSTNLAGNTRNSRIDYVWLSKSATRTKVKASQVFDVRNSKGVAPSDHRPVMTTFEVR